MPTYAPDADANYCITCGRSAGKHDEACQRQCALPTHEDPTREIRGIMAGLQLSGSLIAVAGLLAWLWR